MTSKTRTHAAEPATETDATHAASGAAAIGRQQLASMADATSTLLRASDTLQQVQQHMLQRAALTQQQAAEKLRMATNPTDLWTIQAEMMLLGVTETAQYLQDLAAATLKVQGEMMNRAVPSQAPAVNPAASMLQVWQNMFTAPLNGSSAAHAQ